VLTAPQDADRLIQDALAELGWANADASAIAERVKRLDIGLPCEDEFSVICGWLGKCRILHKLDQQQIPARSREEYQVPDLLALFSTQNTSSPVLIEVKSNSRQTLSFKPNYLKKLEDYANLLNLHLLIAWKLQGIWTLFEAKHLTKAGVNFNISIERAMRENLLGALVGDVAYKIGDRAGLHLRLRKDKLKKQENNGDGITEEWACVIDEARFTDRNGFYRADLDSKVVSLFTACKLEERQDHTDTHIDISYVAGSGELQFAHMSLVHLLNWELPTNQKINWRHLLQKPKATSNIDDFRAVLDLALQQEVVSHIFDQLPVSMPEFIASR